MKITQVIYLGMALVFLAFNENWINADDKSSVMDFAFIQDEGHGFLVVIGDKIGFQKGPPRGRTTWNVELTKDGLRIAESKTGKLLGIDPKKKKVELFERLGPTTTWQIKSTNAAEIKPPRAFKTLLFMKLGDEELRLSSDDMGTPVLGGKADILKVYIDGP